MAATTARERRERGGGVFIIKITIMEFAISGDISEFN